MTDMEQNIYERACGHYKMKHGMSVQMEKYDFQKEDRPDIIKEFWTDYLSGKPIYRFQLRKVS